MAQLDRTYYLYEMATFADYFEQVITQYAYQFTGTVPSWVTADALPSPLNAYNFPNFDIAPPEGTSGTFSFGVTQTQISTLATATGTITINVLDILATPTELPHCVNANIAWLSPSGGWANYIFNGKGQATQDKGKAATFINNTGEKRFSRRDEVYQGVIVDTGKVSPTNADFIGDAFKAIQAYLWEDSGAFTTIMIDPQSFRRVRSGESYAEYSFEFIYAEEDVIQTQ